MPFKVPYQFVDGLPDTSQQQLYRNFEEIQRLLNGVTPPPSGDSTGMTLTPLRLGPSVPYGTQYGSVDVTSRSYQVAGNYVLLADNINTFLNAPTGGVVHLRINNSDVLRVKAADRHVEVLGNLGVTQQVYAADWFRSWDNTGWYSQTHQGGIWMRNSTSVEVYNGKEFYAENWIGALEARMGRWGGSPGHAVFTHSGANDKGWMVRNDYRCWGMANGTIFMRVDGNDVMAIQNDYFHNYRPMNANNQRYHFYNWNDSNHSMKYLGGFDTEGPEFVGWGGTQQFSVANDARARLQWGDGNFVLFDNGGAWGMKSIPSGLALKQDVKTIDKKVALEKLRKLRPVEFKRKYHDARPERRAKLAEVKARPRPEPLPDPGPRPEDDRDEEAISAWLDALRRKEERDREIIQYDWDIENAEAMLEHMEWRWATQFNLEVQRPELGFIAEEMDAVEPAAVLPTPPTPPVRPPGYRKGKAAQTPLPQPPEHERITTPSIMYGQLTSLLAAALQEEDEVVRGAVAKQEALEKRLAAAEEKAARAEERLASLERGRPT